VQDPSGEATVTRSGSGCWPASPGSAAAAAGRVATALLEGGDSPPLGRRIATPRSSTPGYYGHDARHWPARSGRCTASPRVVRDYLEQRRWAGAALTCSRPAT